MHCCKIKIYCFIIFSISLFPGCGDGKSGSMESGRKNESMLTGELKIGLIPEQNILVQKKRYKPLGDYIEKKTGLKINFIILPRYGNIIDNFSNLKLDGAFWGSFTGAIAIKRLSIEHLVRPVNPDGTSTYKGYIFVRKDSNIKSISDMRNKTIAFVDRATTAGYMYPIAYFKDNGIENFKSFFKEYYFTGSHDAVIHAILKGEADIGCVKNTIYDMLARKESRIKGELLVLAESSDVPSNGLGLRKDIDVMIKNRLKNLLLQMDREPDGIQVLKEFRDIKFIENNENDYKPVFEMAAKADIDLANYEYVNK